MALAEFSPGSVGITTGIKHADNNLEMVTDFFRGRGSVRIKFKLFKKMCFYWDGCITRCLLFGGHPTTCIDEWEALWWECPLFTPTRAMYPGVMHWSPPHFNLTPTTGSTALDNGRKQAYSSVLWEPASNPVSSSWNWVVTIATTKWQTGFWMCFGILW